jgi:hypothetical protein
VIRSRTATANNHEAHAAGLNQPWFYGRWWRGVVECVWVFGAYSAYEWVRAQVGRKSAGDHNGLTIIHWERVLHLNVERHFQHFALDHKRFTQFLDLYYGTVHFFVPLIVLWALWRWRSSEYSLWRNRLFVATLIALLGFWLWPLTPPRLMPAHFGFVDTDALYGGQGILNEGAAKDTNLYAAMPSLHVGWALWCAAAAMPLLRSRRARAAVWLYPLFTFMTVTATGNHYWLDGFAGIGVDLLGYWVSTWVTAVLASRHYRLTRPSLSPAILTSQNNDTGGNNERHGNSDGDDRHSRIDVLVKQSNAD